MDNYGKSVDNFMSNPNPEPHLENLKPFQPGDDPRRNLEGRPKGRRSLAQIVKDMLESEFDWSLIGVEGVEKLAELYKGRTAWEALVSVAFAQALGGNTKAMEFLRKSGYGDKLDITSDDKPIQPIAIYDLREHANSDDDTAGDQYEASGTDASGEEPEV